MCAWQGRGRDGSGAAFVLIGWLMGLIGGVAAGLAMGLGAVRPPAGATRDAVSAAPSPLGIPARGWHRILRRTMTEFNEDQIPAVAAGVTFYGLLSLFPALGAFAALYGLFANIEDARRQIDTLAGLLPSGAVSVIGEQMTRLAGANHRGLGMTFAISLALSLWASNAGIKALIGGLNIAYESKERRGFIGLNLVSLAFTIGALVFTALGMGAIAGAPATLTMLGVGRLAGVSFLRWPLVFLIMMGLLSLLYRYGPSRERARWRWVTPGSGAASVGWIAMSLLFSWYVANFGHYDRTYGSLGAIVGFMTWIWLSLIVVLFGAELNAEIESQTSVDTTRRGF